MTRPHINSATTHNTIARKADAVARWSRLDRLALLNHPDPRNLRWWPAFTLIAMVAGYAILVAAIDRHSLSLIWGIIGSLLLFGACGANVYLRILGPFRAANAGRPIDERERMLKARAGHISGIVIAVLAMVICFYCGIAALFGWWAPTGMLDWIYLGILIEGWMLTLPVLVASWLQARPERD